MKKSQFYGFKKLPTSDNDLTDIDISKNSFTDKPEKNQKSFLLKNIWLIIFFIILITISAIWYSTELYWILFKYDIPIPIIGYPKLTIIINSFNKSDYMANLLRSLIDQSFSSYEIIITKSFQSNLSELPFLKFRKKNAKIRFIQYKENDTNLKIRIDSASIATGDYILFLNSDDVFPSDILHDCYKTAIKEKTDITQFNNFHDENLFNDIIYQPQLFDSMFFDNDRIIQKQFHLTGKIIKRDFFLKSMVGIDNFYLENNNNKNFDESIILFILFKKAKTLIKVKPEGIKHYCIKKSCSQKFINKKDYSKNEIKDILIYLKFLIEYTDKTVLEKRMAAQFFINVLIKKRKTINNYNNNLIKLLDEVIKLYSNCSSINDYDIYLIKQYREKINSK